MDFKKIFRIIGPGFITGASDDDPSGIATYSQTGALFGYKQLWTALFTFPCMVIVQQLCGKIGLVTGKGLAQIIRKNYGLTMLSMMVTLLAIANIINIGADLGAMAASGQLLFHFPFALLLFGMTTTIILLEIFVPYKVYAKYLKYLTFSLFSYIITALMIKQDWRQIALYSLVPSIIPSREYFMNAVAILGTTISPYLFFWQAAQEVEDEVACRKLTTMGKGKPHITKRDVRKMREDTTIGMFFSNLVMWFIIITTAATLAKHGITNIETADQAAQALKPFAGDFAFLIFALGIIGTGFLAVPVLAGSVTYAISETFAWKEGLYRKFKDAYGFYVIIALATLVGVIVNFTPIKPFKLLYYTAVLNGLTAPPMMIMIMLITNNKKILGKHTNNLLENIIGWVITIIMMAAAIALLAFF